MGDRGGGGGFGTNLEGLASQWGGSAPANDRYPILQPDPEKRWARPVSNPPANDPGLTPQGQLNQLSGDDLMTQHRDTVTKHQQAHANYRRLLELRGGSTPKNYTEAMLAQAHPDRLNGLIERYTRSLVTSGKTIDEQRYNLYKRAMISPFENQLAQGLHMPKFPDPQQQTASPYPQPRFLAVPGANENQPPVE